MHIAYTAMDTVLTNQTPSLLINLSTRVVEKIIAPIRAIRYIGVISEKAIASLPFPTKRFLIICTAYPKVSALNTTKAIITNNRVYI